MASSDRMAFRYVREDTFKNPASAQAKTLLYTRESLLPQYETVEDETILGDRQQRAPVRSGRQVSGTVESNLIYGNLDDLLEGALADEWASGVLTNGSDLISFAFEKAFGIDDQTTHLAQFTGCRIGTLGVRMAIAAPITASVGITGATFALASGSASIGVGSAASPVSNEMMVSLEQLSIEEGGASPGLDIATEFTFDFDNGLRPQRVLTMTDLRGIGLGTFRASGTLAAYFEDRRFIDKLVADTASEYEIVTQDSAGNSYVWTFPLFKFTTLDGLNSQGRNTDVITRLGWTAYRDPSTGITVRVERQAAS